MDIETMTTADLEETRLRLSTLLWDIEKELNLRRFAEYRQKKPKVTLKASDLAEPSRSRSPVSTRRKAEKKVAAQTKRIGNVFTETLKKLTPEELAKVREALKKQEKK